MNNECLVMNELEEKLQQLSILELCSSKRFIIGENEGITDRRSRGVKTFIEGLLPQHRLRSNACKSNKFNILFF